MHIYHNDWGKYEFVEEDSGPCCRELARTHGRGISTARRGAAGDRMVRQHRQSQHSPRLAYRNDLQELMQFVGISTPAEFRLVSRAHVLAWRKDLEQRAALAGSTLRRKLSAVSSLFEYLCEQNAVTTNPVDGVKRPKVESYEGKTPALGDSPGPTSPQAQGAY